MNFKTVVGVVGVTFFFFCGIILAMATNYWPTSLAVAVLFFAVGFGVVFFVARSTGTVVQNLEVSGEIKAVGMKCPNCGASVDAGKIRILSSVPYATCSYCGHTFEVAEEPKW